jgi:hypothetical protein
MKNVAQSVVRGVQLAAFNMLALGLLGVPVTAAASSEAKLVITATVLKRATLRILAQPPSVVVTAADIARGYVDVPTPAYVAIQSNTRHGYQLEFAAEGDFMRQVMVRGLSNDLQMSPAGGVVMQQPRGTGVTITTLALGFRFLLSESAREGAYAWPMRLSVTAL